MSFQSGRPTGTVMQLIDQLRKQGYMIEDEDHPFYKKAVEDEE